MARRKCSVCGLYVGSKPHTGPMHARIMANRRRMAAGTLGRRRPRRKRVRR